MNTPRRNRVDLMTPVELKIYEASLLVESLDCDIRLTEAQTKLNEARNLIADFIDEKENPRR